MYRQTMQTSQVRFTTGVRYSEVIGIVLYLYTLFFSSLAIYNCIAYMDNLYFFPITSHKRTLYNKQRVL